MNKRYQKLAQTFSRVTCIFGQEGKTGQRSNEIECDTNIFILNSTYPLPLNRYLKVFYVKCSMWYMCFMVVSTSIHLTLIKTLGLRDGQLNKSFHEN